MMAYGEPVVSLPSLQKKLRVGMFLVAGALEDRS